MKFWIFIHLLGFLHAAKNSLIVPSNILRHAEWIQELSVNGTVCRVLESREMAVTPISHCCSPSHCEQHADVQTFSPRGDTVVVRGFASRCPGGDRYICLTNAIIPFAIVNAGREYISSTFPFSSCYEPANATLRYNSVNTNIFSDFVLRMVCSDSRLNVALPRSQLRPLPTHPFVFLHVDKVAGTMLRK